MKPISIPIPEYILERFNEILEMWTVEWPHPDIVERSMLHLTGYILGLADAGSLTPSEWTYLHHKLQACRKYKHRSGKVTYFTSARTGEVIECRHG